MKFGQVYKQALRSEGFPPEWIDSAISYAQLKKCINRLTGELQQIGLDPVTLQKLLKHVEDYNASAEAGDVEYKPFEYILSRGNASRGEAEKKEVFKPKLLFYVDEATGALHRAKLDSETKEKLQMLALETGVGGMKVCEEDDASTSSGSGEENGHASTTPPKPARLRAVEVPLTSDAEFFTKLTTELSGLELLQEREEKRMHDEIQDLSHQIARLTDPDRKANKKLLAIWRQIFQLYVEEGVFFGATERDHSARDAEQATEKWNEFCQKIKENGLMTKIKKKDGVQALDTFMHINREILKSLRFGEINHTAMIKIIKKFDKRTALGVRSALPSTITYPSFAEHVAKAVCSEVHDQILSHVPQIDDYNCPMCMDLKWRPVKLSCGHTFCIRCLIVMQTGKQWRCPLCRSPSVKDANSDNLDLELADFLKKWFPDEVKEKQKYNELMAGVDAYGEVYKEKCSVM